jgi:hypothetical protein
MMPCLRFFCVAVGVVGIGLASPASARASAITFSTLTGPVNLVAGEEATFIVSILGFLTTTTPFTGGEVTVSAAQATVAFDSGEGEISSSSASNPFSFPPIPFSATFTFENPGVYFVTASKTQTEQETTFVFNPSRTTSTFFSETAVDRLQVNVAEAATPTPVPEPGSLSLLGLGVAWVSIVRYRGRRLERP